MQNINNYKIEVSGVEYTLIVNALNQKFFVPNRWIELHPPGLTPKGGHTGSKTKTVSFVATNMFAIPTYDPNKNYKKLKWDNSDYKLVLKPLTVHEEIVRLDRESEIYALSNMNYPMYEYLVKLEELPDSYSKYYNSEYVTIMAKELHRDEEFEATVKEVAIKMKYEAKKRVKNDFANAPSDSTFMVSKNNFLMNYNGMSFNKEGWQLYSFLVEKLPRWVVTSYQYGTRFILLSPKKRRIVINAEDIEIELPRKLLIEEQECNF